jgi:hypothetical protein
MASGSMASCFGLHLGSSFNCRSRLEHQHDAGSIEEGVFADGIDPSKSFASLRWRLIQARKRSTTQLRGSAC